MAESTSRDKAQQRTRPIGSDVAETLGTSPKFRTELAEQLAELLPEVIADGKIDVAKLKELLADDAGSESERFGLYWPGKRRALKAAQEPTTATLKPCPELSEHWDTTGNALIEGDNLEVLKVLQRHYHGKIKMIYIDPPYNTGKDFVYPDDYKEGLQTYLQFTKQVDKEGKKLRSNSESAGRYHSNWLNMMYPRLKLARNLLTDDGVIFISIDDHEVAHLRRLCDEIFGESNFLGVVVWKNATDNNPTHIASEHEYIVVYARRADQLPTSWRTPVSDVKSLLLKVGDELTQRYDDQDELQAAYTSWFRKHKSQLWPMDRYKYIDSHGIYIGSQSVHNPGKEGYRYDVIHPVTGKPCKEPLMGYRFPRETMDQLLEEDRILFGDDHDKIIELKVYARDFMEKLPSVIELDGRLGAYDLRSLFPEVRKLFTNPKPVKLLMQLFSQVLTSDDLILDFFAGSNPAAEAVYRMNADNDARFRYIAIQLPEPVDRSTEVGKNASTLGLETISDIAMERARRAAKAVAAEQKSGNSAVDRGFRVYKLVDTNFSKWQVSSGVGADVVQQQLLDLRESTDDAAAPDDLLTEVLLKQGYSLTESVEKVNVAGLDVRLIDGGLLTYLDEHTKPTLEQLRALVAAAGTKIVVLEDAFQGDDELKTNLVQLCKTKSIELWTA